MSDLSNSISEDQSESEKQALNALRKQAAEQAHAKSAGIDNRVDAAVAQAQEAGRNRETAAQNDLKRSQEAMREYARRNPALQASGQSDRSSIDQRIARFADQQREHVALSEARANGMLEALAGAARQLQTQQSVELKRTPAAEQASLQQHHENQRRALAELAGSVASALIDVRRRDNHYLKIERQGVNAALASGSREGIDAALANVDRQAERERLKEWSRAPSTKHADEIALAADTRRSVKEILGALSPKDAQRWREQLGDAAKVLDDAAITRIKLAGDSRRKPEDAVNAIKGQLFEELMTTGQRVEELLALAQKELDARGINAKAQFFAGDRIRDESGYRKLTDGMIAWEDEQQKLHIMKVLEAKAGQEYADKLVQLKDKATAASESEGVDFINDVLEDEIERGATQEVDREKRFVELANALEDELEAGQSRRTIERLTTDEKYETNMYIDGKRRELAFQQAPKVDTVTPRDVLVVQPLKEDATAAEKKEHERRSRDSTYRDSRKLDELTEKDLVDAARRAAEFREQERKRERDKQR